jgi:outer membrane lipoprotein-sorting protein
MRRHLPFIFVLLALSLASVRAADAPAPKEDPGLIKRLEAIDARAGDVQDLFAHFKQEKFTALLKRPLVSSGTVRVKGTKVRWDTEKPEPVVLYMDAAQLKLYYPGQKLLEIYPIDRRLSELAASPLPRLQTLRQHFWIEQIPLKDFGTSGATEDQQVALKLTPKDASLAEHLQFVRVLLDVKNAHILKAETTDAADVGEEADRTLITFSDVKTNAGLKDEDLNLVVPKGTKESRPLEGITGGGRK